MDRGPISNCKLLTFIFIFISNPPSPCFIVEMLSSINPTSITNSSVSCWPALEPALNKLFPSPAIIAIATTNTPPHFDLGSEDYLKLYTVVFDHCVGLAEGRREGKSASAALPAGLNISGEELYLTLVKYLETRFEQWSIYLIVIRASYLL